MFSFPRDRCGYSERDRRACCDRAGAERRSIYVEDRAFDLYVGHRFRIAYSALRYTLSAVARDNGKRQRHDGNERESKRENSESLTAEARAVNAESGFGRGAILSPLRFRRAPQP